MNELEKVLRQIRKGTISIFRRAGVHAAMQACTETGGVVFTDLGPFHSLEQALLKARKSLDEQPGVVIVFYDGDEHVVVGHDGTVNLENLDYLRRSDSELQRLQENRERSEEIDRLRQRIEDATLAQQCINGSPEVEDLVLVSYRGDDYRGELSAKIAANEVFKLTSDGNALVEIGPAGVTLWVTHPEGEEDYLDTWARVDGFCSYAAVYNATRQCQGMAIRTPAYQSTGCRDVQETTKQMSLGLEILKTKLRMLELRTK